MLAAWNRNASTVCKSTSPNFIYVHFYLKPGPKPGGKNGGKKGGKNGGKKGGKKGGKNGGKNGGKKGGKYGGKYGGATGVTEFVVADCEPYAFDAVTVNV